MIGLFLDVIVLLTRCTTGVGTLEISGGIYNTAGFLPERQLVERPNIIASKTQALGSLA